MDKQMGILKKFFAFGEKLNESLLLSRFKILIVNCPPAMRDRQCFFEGIPKES
jgi:hypothetical protein